MATSYDQTKDPYFQGGELAAIGDVGTILANDGTTSHVHWDTLKDAPYWPNIRLEPADELPTSD
jgi:hypothetical protein